MKRIALLLAAAVAGLVSLCAGVLTYGYLVVSDMPERAFRSQGPNAAWAANRWVDTLQNDAAYGRVAAQLRRNQITDVYFYMGWLEANGTIPRTRYAAAPVMLRELKAQYPALRLHAWIGQVEMHGGGTLDLADAEVRRKVTATAERFLAIGFDGIHYGFPAAGSGNPHLLMLLDQTRLVTAAARAVLSIDADPLEPLPGLAWLARETGSQNGYWTRAYYRAVISRVDQIAVLPVDTTLPARWLTAGLVAWQTRAIRPLAMGRATLFVGIPPIESDAHEDGDGGDRLEPFLVGIRKGMSARADDPFTDFGVAVDLASTSARGSDRALLEDWLDSSALVAR